MLEYIQFYTKNLSNFTILLLIGVVIAILDITIRNVIKDVYLNVRENMRLRHGGSNGREGMENKDTKGEKGEKSSTANTETESEESCPKDCNAVEELRKRLTVLVENAKNLQNNINQNNNTIMNQQRIIENMKKAVDKVIEASNKKK